MQMKKSLSGKFSSSLIGIGLCCIASQAYANPEFFSRGGQPPQTRISLNSGSNSSSQNEYTDRIIVKYQDNALAMQSMVNTQHLTATTGESVDFVRITALSSAVYQLNRRMPLAEIEQLARQIAARDDVLYAEPDAMMQPVATPDDSRYNEQWHYYETIGGINLPSAWDQTSGQGAVVAVLDTGYRPHVDLSDNLLPGYDMISGTFVARDGDGRDSDASDPGDWINAGDCGNNSPPQNISSSWHGTHVAGTVSAVTNNSLGVAGVAYGAKVVPVRVLGRCGGYLSDIADAIVWAAGGVVTGVPANQNPANVINLSLGGSGLCGATYQNVINYATSNDTSVITAAGNTGVDVSNFRPANCNGVVTVAATRRDGGKASYSNYGAAVEVAAPGNSVLSTLNSGNTTPGSDNYAFYTGTSMATPHVSGVAALMYSINPNLSTTQVSDILQNTARAFPSTCNQCGAGIVDAASAVSAVPGVPTVPGDVTLLAGEMSLRHLWITETLSGISNPRIVMGVPSYNGSAPTTVRVANATDNHFSTHLDEWDYKNGNHTTEIIGFLAVENGNSNFGSLDVKSGLTDMDHNWKTINFSLAFTNSPVVVAQVVTVNDPAAVTTRIRNVTSTSFEIRLQEEEQADGIHAIEQVHWIAVESGSATVNGQKLTAAKTDNTVTHNWKTIDFSSTSNPVFLAAMQTFDGSDTAALRYTNLTSTSIQVKVEEEKSKNPEVSHTTEVIGYIVLGD